MTVYMCFANSVLGQDCVYRVSVRRPSKSSTVTQLQQCSVRPVLSSSLYSVSLNNSNKQNRTEQTQTYTNDQSIDRRHHFSLLRSRPLYFEKKKNLFVLIEI